MIVSWHPTWRKRRITQGDSCEGSFLSSQSIAPVLGKSKAQFLNSKTGAGFRTFWVADRLALGVDLWAPSGRVLLCTRIISIGGGSFSLQSLASFARALPVPPTTPLSLKTRSSNSFSLLRSWAASIQAKASPSRGG